MRPKGTANHPSGVFLVPGDVSQDIESMEKPCLRNRQEGAGRGLFYLLKSFLLLTPVWPTDISIPPQSCVVQVITLADIQGTFLMPYSVAYHPSLELMT